MYYDSWGISRPAAIGNCSFSKLGNFRLWFLHQLRGLQASLGRQLKLHSHTPSWSALLAEIYIQSLLWYIRVWASFQVSGLPRSLADVTLHYLHCSCCSLLRKLSSEGPNPVTAGWLCGRNNCTLWKNNCVFYVACLCCFFWFLNSICWSFY